MNVPPYIVVDEIGTKNSGDVLTGGLLYKVKTELSLSVLNYQYGYWEELKETLGQMEAPGFTGLKYPLVWLTQPFTITSGPLAKYGTIDELRFFIASNTVATYKAAERMTNVYKPILIPILEELTNQLFISKAFADYRGQMVRKVTDRYFWGNDKPLLNDKVDMIEVRFSNVKIHNNKNCLN